MALNVYDWPIEWYQYIVTQKFNLRSLNQAGAMPWVGIGQAIMGPFAQAWLTDVTMAPMQDPVLQDMDGFFSRLRGRSGLLRISNTLRLAPWYDRALTPTTTVFSDGTRFTDKTGFADGFLPPAVYLTANAAKGSNYIVLGGLPASLAGAIRRGDLLEIQPINGALTVPHLYKAVVGGNTDSNGQIGLQIEPRLRAGVAASDVVSLRYPSTVFRLADDTQGEIEMSGTDHVGNFGFSLIEALDQVP